MPEYGKSKNSTKDKDAQTIKTLWDKGLRAINTERFEYQINESFLLGQQWLQLDRVSNTLREIPESRDRPHITVNRLWPASRSMMAKLVSRDLVFQVMPNAADDASMRAARLSEGVVETVHREHEWENLREDALWATWKSGTAAISIEWDPTAGVELGVSETGRTLGIGDTCETVLNMLEFVVEPGVRVAERARWWIRATAIPPAEAKERYKLEDEPAADTNDGSYGSQQRLYQDRYSSAGDANLTMVLTYYERPNAKNKEGRVCVVIGEKIVEECPWPFPFKDKLNLVVLRETHLDGVWHGKTILTAARPVQAALNHAWQNIIEHLKLAGSARLFIPNSAADLASEMTDLPGEVQLWPDGIPVPSYVTPPVLPNWVMNAPDLLAAEIDDILGQHDVSRGQAPKNVDSGLGLSILVEQDSTPLGRLVKETAMVFGRLASLVLEIYSANVKERRTSIVRMAGRPPETAKWTGKALIGHTTATVPTDKIIPRSRAQSQAFATQAMQMGLITTMAEYAHLAELPNSNDMLEVLDPDIAKARRENHRMAMGEVQVPEDFDEHNKHIKEHLTEMKGPRWDTLSMETRNVFVLHNQAHATLSAEQLGMQMQKAQTSPALAAAASPIGAPTIDPNAAAVISAQRTEEENMAMQEVGQMANPPMKGGASSPSGPPQGA